MLRRFHYSRLLNLVGPLSPLTVLNDWLQKQIIWYLQYDNMILSFDPDRM